MNVLGISGGFGHDAAAALVCDGSVVAMLEEERVTRRKHAPGDVPLHATLFCLDRAGLALGDIDVVACSWDPGLDPTAGYLREVLERYLGHEIWDGLPRPRVEFVRHHLAHAAAAVHASGFERCAVVVVDGNGEDCSTSVGRATPAGIELSQTLGAADSLGHFYTTVTEFVGLGAHAEGKLMGLAAYGTPRWEVDLIEVGHGSYRIRMPAVDHLPASERYGAIRDRWMSWLEATVGLPNRGRFQWSGARGGAARALALPERYTDLAASAQRALGDAVLELVRGATAAADSRRLALSGGVALNCGVNGRIASSGLVDELYIAPASHDAGGALGAALAVAAAEGPIAPFDAAFLGPAFDDTAIADGLRPLGVPLAEPTDVVTEAARRLAAGQIIGWFQGRAENGPRALGRRSILALPSSTAVRDRVNRLKGREPWRPLSPSLLAEARADWYDGPASPYMLVAAPARPGVAEAAPAVVHRDGTIRVQTVDPSDPSPYRRLLAAVHAETGCPALLNTSFNVGGEPIVSSPGDTIRSFACSELDALVLGPFLLSKRVGGLP